MKYIFINITLHKWNKMNIHKPIALHFQYYLVQYYSYYKCDNRLFHAKRHYQTKKAISLRFQT